jgi:hypothetical protein
MRDALGGASTAALLGWQPVKLSLQKVSSSKKSMLHVVFVLHAGAVELLSLPLRSSQRHTASQVGSLCLCALFKNVVNIETK